MTERAKRDRSYKQNVIFSDAATFMLSAHVNLQTYLYWPKENPHWIEEHSTQYPQKLKF